VIPGTLVVFFVEYSQTGAIIYYLIDTYGKDAKFTYNDFPNKYLLKHWYFFQMTGQGPFYDQKAWYVYECWRR